MEKNVGTIDRIARTFIALFFIIVACLWWNKIPVVAGLLLIISGMLFSSVASGYCPLYTKLGVNTNK